MPNVTANLTAAQCRKARRKLEWSVRELSRQSGVAPGTILRFENGEKTNDRTIKDIKRMLLAAGVSLPK
jgi:transcriptional regulator with XRE-family HTH domain